MSAGPRIAVIGGGAAGLSCALHAAQLGARSVVVLEQDYPATGSSGLSAGIFNCQTTDPLELELRARSVAYLGELERDHDLPLTRNGYVRAARTSGVLERFEKTVERQRALGIDDSRVISADELRALVPGIAADDLAGGLYGPSDGHFDGHLLCATYLALGEAAGVELRTRCRVAGADFRPGGVTLRTNYGSIECDVVVNAAGAWASRVAELLDTSLPVIAQRHQICIVHLDEPMLPLPPAVNEYVPGSGDYALYFRPEGPQQWIAGLHTHEALSDKPTEDPDNYARGVDFDYVELVAEHLAHRFEREDLRLESGWSGLYPISPDGRFQVGPHPEQPRVVAAGGLGGVGLTLSPIVGQLAAEWAVRGVCSKSFASELCPGRASLELAVER